MFGGIKVNENCINWYNQELMQLFGELETFPFVRISCLNWTGHVNRMDSKRKVSQIFNNNNSQGRWQRGWQKTLWNCIQTDIDRCQIKNWKER
jgi:hypothetical protein